jgi:protein SCO1/2
VKSTTKTLLAGALILLAAAAGTIGWQHVQAPAVEQQAFQQEQIEFPDVTLIDQHSGTHSLRGKLTDGKLLVINFNYTTCNSICPLGNVVMQALESRIDEKLRDKTRLLSITIDPRTDTPDLLLKASREYAAGPSWLWLTGTPTDIGSVLSSAGASVSDIELHDPVFLVGRADTGFFFRSTSMPDAEDLVRLLETLNQT